MRLSTERWEHIERRHPELADRLAEVLETLTTPDLILEGDAGASMAVRRIRSGPLRHKHVVVVFRELPEAEGFVITAYVARRLKEGRRIVWPT